MFEEKIFGLYFTAFGAGFLQNGFNAVLGNGTQRSGGNFQRDPPVFGWNIQAFLLQVRVELAPGLVVCVRYVVARLGFLAGKFTNSCHGLMLYNLLEKYTIRIPHKNRAANVRIFACNSKNIRIIL